MYLFAFEGYDPKKEPYSRQLLLMALELYMSAEGLSADENPDIKETKTGKPYFSNLNVDFSVSHTGQLWMCAMGKGEIGLDIQAVKYVNYMKLASRYFTADETAFIRNRYIIKTACGGEKDQAEGSLDCDCGMHEHTHIDEISGRNAFFDIWTAKEAIAKMKGTSIFREMSSAKVVSGGDLLSSTGDIFLKRIYINDDIKCALAFNKTREGEEICTVMMN